jgi:hypothetical protein
MFSKLIPVIVTIFIIAWVVQNPAGAGDTVHHWITGVITFMQHLS